LENGSGTTTAGDPYRRVFLPNGALMPGQSIVETLVFKHVPHDAQANFSLVLLSGQGNP
jgi:hypothetical protein